MQALSCPAPDVLWPRRSSRSMPRTVGLRASFLAGPPRAAMTSDGSGWADVVFAVALLTTARFALPAGSPSRRPHVMRGTPYQFGQWSLDRAGRAPGRGAATRLAPELARSRVRTRICGADRRRCASAAGPCCGKACSSCGLRNGEHRLPRTTARDIPRAMATQASSRIPRESPKGTGEASPPGFEPSSASGQGHGRVPEHRRSSFGPSHPRSVANCSSLRAISSHARSRLSGGSGRSRSRIGEPALRTKSR